MLQENQYARRLNNRSLKDALQDIPNKRVHGKSNATTHPHRGENKMKKMNFVNVFSKANETKIEKMRRPLGQEKPKRRRIQKSTTVARPPSPSTHATKPNHAPKKIVKKTTIEDVRQPSLSEIFQEHKNDPQYAVEYLPHIFTHYRQVEMQYHPRKDYMDEQRDISIGDRAVLIDWLVDVHRKFEMNRATIFVCVNLVDRYLSLKRVRRRELQLVGCTCLYIASKYEEIYQIPPIKDLVAVCARVYRKDDFEIMEKRILKVLGYCLTAVTSNQLLPVMLESLNSLPYCDNLMKKKITKLCEFMTEMYLHDYEYLKFSPSRIAATTIFLSCRIVFGNKKFWNETFLYYIGYREDSLVRCGESMLRCLKYYALDKDNKKEACMRKFWDVDSFSASRIVKKYVEKRVL